jgi:hypothetical protein
MEDTRILSKDIPQEDVGRYVQLCLCAFLKEHRRLVVKPRFLTQVVAEGFPRLYLHKTEEGNYVLSIEILIE